MRQLRAVRELRLRAAVEMHAFCAPGEIGLAQDRLRAVAVKAVAAVRIPGQHDVIAGTDVAHRAADLLDHAGRLMAEDHRQRIAQRSIDHLEVGVGDASEIRSTESGVPLRCSTAARQVRVIWTGSPPGACA